MKLQEVIRRQISLHYFVVSCIEVEKIRLKEAKAQTGQYQQNEAEREQSQGRPALPTAAPDQVAVAGVGGDTFRENFLFSNRLKSGHLLQPPGPPAIDIRANLTGPDNRFLGPGFTHNLYILRPGL